MRKTQCLVGFRLYTMTQRHVEAERKEGEEKAKEERGRPKPVAPNAHASQLRVSSASKSSCIRW